MNCARRGLPSWGSTTVFRAEPRTANATRTPRTRDRTWVTFMMCVPTPVRDGSGDRLRGLLHRLVHVGLVDLELLGHLLLGLELGLLDGVLNRRLAEDHQRSLSGVDGLAELLDVGTRHPLPQVSAHAADGRTDDGCSDDGGREQDAHQGTRGGAAPGALPGGGLVLVDVDLPLVVLGDHSGVIGAHGADRVEVLDDVVVGAGVDFAGVRPDVDEDAIGLRHGIAPFQGPNGWDPRTDLPGRSP